MFLEVLLLAQLRRREVLLIRVGKRLQMGRDSSGRRNTER
jgi:hypothetical protein